MPTASPQTTTRGQYVNPKALALKYRFNGDFCVHGRPVILSVDPVDSERSFLATGLRVWDGGIVLAKYLERYVPAVPRAPGRLQLRGLDLGCGTGVAGLSFALTGQYAVLSDLGDVQAVATQANIGQNMAHIAAAGGSACFHVLDWCKLPDRAPFGYFDIVFAGDVIWHETLVEPFMNAVAWSASGPGAGEILLSHKTRDAQSIIMFEAQASKLGFILEKKVPTEQVLGDDGHPDVVVYHLRKR